MATAAEKAAQVGTDLTIVGSAIGVVATGGLAFPIAALVVGLAAFVVGCRTYERTRGKG